MTVSTGLEVIDCVLEAVDPRLVPDYMLNHQRSGNLGLRPGMVNLRLANRLEVADCVSEAVDPRLVLDYVPKAGKCRPEAANGERCRQDWIGIERRC